MKPTRTLPPGYQPIKTLDLGVDKKALLILNLIGLIIFVAFGWLFVQLTLWFHPTLVMESFSFTLSSSGEVVITILKLVLLIAAMVVFHEGIHGICFWMITRTRPKFAFKGAYAYAAAPGWYIPRTPYLITSLAPFVVITVLCGVLIKFASPEWFFSIILFATLNASGAIGDLFVAFWLIQQPPSCLALDQGDSATLYNETLSPPDNA